MSLNQNIIKKTYLFFISFLFIFFSCNSDDEHNVAVAGVSIADVSVPRGTASFDISPTLIPSGATADYSLIDPPTGVTVAGTKINIPANMTYGEYNITVKAIGKDNYNGETEATFKLTIVFKNDDFVINFKDVNFKNAVKSYFDIRTNEVTYGDIKNVTNLVVEEEGVTNMEEIIYFTSLRELRCYGNPLTSLDLSRNTYLKELYCYDNQLTSLDLSQNTRLKKLYCSSNKLRSLDLRQNTVLEDLKCDDNQLTSLDLRQNTVLEELDCYDNQLTSLDLRQNTVLEELECDDNQLRSLDLSQNTVLEELDCYDNQLTSLDIRGMRRVDWLSFDNTTLQTLKVHQNIKASRSIVFLKITRGSNVTISTYSAPEGSTNYKPICNDYTPRAGGGSCND